MILYLSKIQAFRQMRALVSLVVMSRDRAGIASCRCCFVQLNLSRARERAREASLPLTCRAARQIICTHTYFYVLALCCMYVPLERATYVPLERGYVRIHREDKIFFLCAQQTPTTNHQIFYGDRPNRPNLGTRSCRLIPLL